MHFIKFLQPDPDYKLRPAEVVVSTGAIVKIEPRYYGTAADGQRWLTQVTQYGPAELEEGIERQYIVYDSLGNKYNSDTATSEGRDLIEQLWNSAK